MHLKRGLESLDLQKPFTRVSPPKRQPFYKWGYAGPLHADMQLLTRLELPDRLTLAFVSTRAERGQCKFYWR